MFYKSYVHAEGRRQTTAYEDKSIPLDPHSLGEAEEMCGPKDKLATYGFIQAQLSNLMGGMLTIADGVFTDPVQRKAVKDMMKSEFNERYGFIAEQLLDQEVLDKTATEYLEAHPEVEPEPVDIAVAMGVEDPS